MLPDRDKTKEQLINELAQMRQRIIELEASETERRLAGEETKQLQEYLQLQVARMPIGLVAWDTEFRVQTWNPAAEKMFGFTVEEALGKHPYDLIVPKEAQPHVDDIWRRLLEGDTTAHSINENMTKMVVLSYVNGQTHHLKKLMAQWWAFFQWFRTSPSTSRRRRH